MKRLSIILILLLAGLAAWNPAVLAQPRPAAIAINGKVTSFEESLPLEGAVIVVKGTSNTTGTQADGTFTLLIAPADSILIVSLNGYEPKEIKTSAKSKQYDIVLKRSDKSISLRSPCTAADSRPEPIICR